MYWIRLNSSWDTQYYMYGHDPRVSTNYTVSNNLLTVIWFLVHQSTLKRAFSILLTTFSCPCNGDLYPHILHNEIPHSPSPFHLSHVSIPFCGLNQVPLCVSTCWLVASYMHNLLSMIHVGVLSEPTGDTGDALEMLKRLPGVVVILYTCRLVCRLTKTC